MNREHYHEPDDLKQKKIIGSLNKKEFNKHISWNNAKYYKERNKSKEIQKENEVFKFTYNKI